MEVIITWYKLCELPIALLGVRAFLITPGGMEVNPSFCSDEAEGLQLNHLKECSGLYLAE
ncbi:MAG: hypothetical protein HY929_01975 [Euryarchaeota archaeon]|nr:hypothetical protein [Euryarchaeota archaeon]